MERIIDRVLDTGVTLVIISVALYAAYCGYVMVSI